MRLIQFSHDLYSILFQVAKGFPISSQVRYCIEVLFFTYVCTVSMIVYMYVCMYDVSESRLCISLDVCINDSEFGGT